MTNRYFTEVGYVVQHKSLASLLYTQLENCVEVTNKHGNQTGAQEGLKTRTAHKLEI